MQQETGTPAANSRLRHLDARPEKIGEPKPTSRAFLGAYRKGRQARRDGKRVTFCPYADKRGNYHNNVTFARSFIGFWEEGWNDERAGKPERYAVRAKRKPTDSPNWL